MNEKSKMREVVGILFELRLDEMRAADIEELRAFNAALFHWEALSDEEVRRRIIGAKS